MRKMVMEFEAGGRGYSVVMETPSKWVESAVAPENAMRFEEGWALVPTGEPAYFETTYTALRNGKAYGPAFNKVPGKFETAEAAEAAARAFAAKKKPYVPSGKYAARVAAAAAAKAAAEAGSK